MIKGKEIILHNLLKAYNEYTYREFESESLKELPFILDLAFTSTESGKQNVQVKYDILLEQINEYINNTLINSYEVSVEDFTKDLASISFEGIISDILFEAEERENTFD